MNRKRKIFNIVAGVGLGVFWLYVLLIVGALIAAKKPEPQARPMKHEVLIRTRIEDLSFSPDGRWVQFRKVSTFRVSSPDPLEPGGDVERTEQVQFPTDRKASSTKPTFSLDVARRTIQLLLHQGRFVATDNAPVALSSDALELAYVVDGMHASVIYRNRGGRARDLISPILSPQLTRLTQANERKPEMRKRLMSADLEPWCDAAIEAILNNGATSRVPCDRLLSEHDLGEKEIAFLIRLMTEFDTPDKAEQSARALYERSNKEDVCVQLIRLMADNFQVMKQLRQETIQALAEKDFGRKLPCPSLREYLLFSVTDGTFASLPAATQIKLLEIQKQLVVRDDVKKLGPIVDVGQGVDVVACAILIGHVCGLQAPLTLQSSAADAQRWYAQNKPRLGP